METFLGCNGGGGGGGGGGADPSTGLEPLFLATVGLSNSSSPPGHRHNSHIPADNMLYDTRHHRSPYSLLYGQVLLLSYSAVSSLVSAHSVGGGGATSGEPCPFLGTPDQQGHHQQVTFRALAERTGDGGIPEGGYQAVMTDLKALMTDSKDFWPGDFAGTPHGPHYGG
jgi:hypothetical protein